MPTRSSNPLRPLLAIVGATATDKTAIARQIADEIGASLLSVDSRKIYRGLDIGTAKPSREHQKRYRYAMIDCEDITEHYSAGQFFVEARRIVAERREQNENVILVGGTGFYLDAFIHGLHDLPTIDPAIRQSVLDTASQMGWEAIHAEVASADPADSERIHPADKTRLLRAAETYRQTGKPLSFFLKKQSSRDLPWPIVAVVIEWNRTVLYDRIARRTEKMMESGLKREVQDLLDRGIPADAPGLNTVGYREMVAHVNGQSTEQEAVAKIVRNTRRFAKRQMTWFRHRSYLHALPYHPNVYQDIIKLWSSFDSEE